MRLESKKYLFDIQRAATLLASFIQGKAFEDYTRDPMLRAAVEREFEIIGEALSQLAKLDSQLAARISEYRRHHRFPESAHPRLCRCGRSARLERRGREAPHSHL